MAGLDKVFRVMGSAEAGAEASFVREVHHH